MDDPFLRAICEDRVVFSIGGSLYPVSIKDQIIRAQLFARRAFAEGIIRRSEVTHSNAVVPPLVVVGGGVAGVVATMEAARLGVPVVLIEKKPHPFPLQMACGTRRIDPTQYDWPARHWTKGRYPFRRFTVPCPLPWNQPELSNVLGINWQIKFDTFVGAESPRNGWSVTPYYGYSFTGWDWNNVAPPAVVRVLLSRDKDTPAGLPHAPPSVDACALLFSAGFGEEHVQASMTAGVRFWATDDLSLPDYNLRAMGVAARILISGGGDGALQDYLRVMTLPALQWARPIYEACGIPKRVEAQIREDQAAVDRHYKWGFNPGHDHAPLRWLQKRCAAAASRALADSSVQGRLPSVVRDPVPDARLVYPCSHFGPVYALNRFLVLLLAGFLKQRPAPLQRDTLIGGFKLDRVVGTHGHVCDGDWTHCYGKPHSYKIVPADCALQDRPGVPRRATANVLIIRHGVRPPRIGNGSMPGQAVQRRHILPYGLFP